MGMTILVVDDETSVRTAIQRLLRSEGFRVFAAESAKQGLDIALEETVDLILLDVHLGQRLAGSQMDGLDLCRTLKNDPRTNPIPVIMLTAHGDRDHVISSRDAGAADFVIKPYESDKLLQKIRKFLGLESPPAAAAPATGAAPAIPAAARKRGADELTRVLVIDDEVSVCSAIMGLLMMEGFVTEAAHTPASAKESIAAHKPDLVLLDTRLGSTPADEMDGLALCREIKSDPQTRDIAVIVLTAYTDPATLSASKTAGADDFVIKPFDSDILLKKIKARLN